MKKRLIDRTNIGAYLTHVDNEEDKDILTRKVHNVNIRMLKQNPFYKHLIEEICEYITEISLTKFDEYSWPYGCSGANIGIPFNIISIVAKVNTGDDPQVWVLINPRIVHKSNTIYTGKSNCGSLRLDEKIDVVRNEVIKVEFYNIEGERHEQVFSKDFYAGTVQHEIDHNNGILITDRTPQSLDNEQ